MESMAAMRSMRFFLRTSCASYSSRPPLFLMCRFTALGSLYSVRAISTPEDPDSNNRAMTGHSAGPLCVCAISTECGLPVLLFLSRHDGAVPSQERGSVLLRAGECPYIPLRAQQTPLHAS